MVSSMTEKNYAEEVVLSEAPGRRSREVVTLLTGRAYKAGEVLGKITSGGKYTICDNVTPASNGSQNAVAVLLQDVDATGGDQPGLVLDCDAEVKADLLVYIGTADNTAKAAQRTNLRTVGIKTR